MLNDILLGRSTLEQEPGETDPYRMPGAARVQSLPASQPTFVARPQDYSAFGADLEIEDNRRRSDVMFGFVLLAFGLMITVITHEAASQDGGRYILAYGPMLAGLIKIIRGLVR